MLTIVVPMAGESAFFPKEEFQYPKAFQDICGRPMIQVVIENLLKIKRDKRFVFIINDKDAKKFGLENVLKMLAGINCEIIVQNGSAKGSVCSLLLAVKLINNDGPTLISNSDQIIKHDLNEILVSWESKKADGGVAYFDSVHPRWSYIKLATDGKVTEAVEKVPISRNAVAGLYYFKHGSDFVNSAMDAIKKDRNYEGAYYTSAVLNEMILRNKTIESYLIGSDEYDSFYSPAKIREYEQKTRGA